QSESRVRENRTHGLTRGRWGDDFKPEAHSTNGSTGRTRIMLFERESRLTMSSDEIQTLSGISDEYQSLYIALDSGGGIFKRILECREMAASLNSLFPSTLPHCAETLLDHLAYLDGWLLQVAARLPPEYSQRNLVAEEVAAGDRKKIYRNNHWVAFGD
ncbi:hypothetical protein CYD30_20705, partial [Kosakonia cowanii]